MYKRKGYPEKGDFVICTITRTLPHSAFADLDEYINKEGMIHASELQRKWVRNVKSMLKEGRKLVCKVVDVDADKGHINLSVKRVGAAQGRAKMEEWKNEQKSYDILDLFAKANKVKTDALFEEILSKISKDYGNMFDFFIHVAKEGKSAAEGFVKASLLDNFVELVQKRVVIPKTVIEGEFTITCNASDGIEKIKAILQDILNLTKKHNAEVKLVYLGAPKYNFKITSDDYEDAEAVFSDIEKILEGFSKLGNTSVKRKKD